MSDERERKTALDPSRSFIVEAPAGSGKTTLLVQRFLRLLSTVDRPESVVAMTFTRKAAQEMHERVLKELVQATSDDVPASEVGQTNQELAREVLRRAESKQWYLLEDPTRLQILTIDALCVQLVQQMPVLARFGGSLQVVEKANLFYKLAARRALQVMAEGDELARAAFRRLCIHFGNDLQRAEAGAMELLAQRDRLRVLTSVSDQDLQIVRDVAWMLNAGVQQLDLVFQERGEIDFTGITQAATQALGAGEQPTDLLFTLDYRIEHLLVDEFQDTSRAQYELLAALTAQWSEGDGHTLFLVGDPMQSIYGFREADVGLFLKCWEEGLGSVRLEPLRLRTNFRSTASILSWIAKAMTPAMPKDDRAVGAVQLRDSEAAEGPVGPPPSVHAFVNDRSRGEEAQRVASLVREALRKGESTAILVRSRPNVERIVRELREQAIPYEAIDMDSLRQQQHILDVVSLARAVTHVGDRVAWLACLRAPWCGLRLGDLSALAEGQEQRTILDLLSDVDQLARLSPDGRHRAISFAEVARRSVEQAQRIPVRQLVEGTWLALGGPAVLEQPQFRDDVALAFDVMEEADEGGAIRDFSLLSTRLSEMFAKPRVSKSAVKIMTIHGAKGLEFDTVILPQLQSSPAKCAQLPLAWGADARTGEIKIRACPEEGCDEPEFEALHDLRKAREDHEHSRLLYVAMTRARRNLHLLGNAKLTKKGAVQKGGSNTHLGKLWATVSPEFETALAEHKKARRPKQQVLELDGPKRTELRRLPSGWAMPAMSDAVQWAARFERDQASQGQRSYGWVSNRARHVGTLVHEFLKRIPEEGLELWPRTRVQGSGSLIESELRRMGVRPTELSEAVNKTVGALQTALASERGRWILSGHPEARCEFPLAGRIGERLVSGAVDRVFRDRASGRLWVIDYKTSEHEGGSLDKFVSAEQERYRNQLEQYAALLAHIKSLPISLGLYFPLLDAWREWAFEESAVGAGKSVKLV